MTPKAQTTKVKVYMWDSIKLKALQSKRKLTVKGNQFCRMGENICKPCI